MNLNKNKDGSTDDQDLINQAIEFSSTGNHESASAAAVGYGSASNVGENQGQTSSPSNISNLFELARQELSDSSKKLEVMDTNGEASEFTCSTVLTEIKAKAGANATMGQVFLCVAMLLQKGGTSPKTPGTQMYKYGNASVTVEIIRNACRSHKCTVRQLARGLKDQIIDLMIELGSDAPSGNLAKSMMLELKEVSKEEAIWASDFQTYNERCPFKVRSWLVRNYRLRFRQQR